MINVIISRFSMDLRTTDVYRVLEDDGILIIKSHG